MSRRGTFIFSLKSFHIEHVFCFVSPTTDSYKKPLTIMNENLYPKTNSSAALSVGRRLLYNRFRSSIGGTGQQQQLSLSPSSPMGSNSGRSSSSSSGPRSPAPLLMTGQQVASSLEEKANCRASEHPYEHRTSSSKSNGTGRSADGTVTYEDHCVSPGLAYSNLSVIPQLSSALFSCAPITALHLNSNAAANSPEANLRNMLLQQLLSSQQHQQLPSMQPIVSTATVPLKNTVTDLSGAHFSESSNFETTWHNSSSLIDSMLTDSSCTCPNIAHKENNGENTSCCHTDEQVSDY